MLIAITGPAGSGKTTTAQALVKKFKRGVHIDMDTVKHFVCTGFLYDESVEGLVQWELLGTNIAALISNFLEQDYDVIVNGCVHTVTWQKIVERNSIDHRILLFPDEQTNISRDLQRASEIAMGKVAVLQHREFFKEDKFYQDWKSCDFSDESIEESVEVLDKLIKA